MSKAKLLLLIAGLSISSCLPGAAQEFSYVYIQGDKKTPLYVKAEGEMMPRYGKNYALLSRLAPGPLNIDILFQQNEYPPLHFTVLVPENGKRAFMVNKKGNQFTLYDLEQHFDLKPDNDISDDHLPAVIDNNKLAAKSPETVAIPPQTPEQPGTTGEESGRIKVWEDPVDSREEPPAQITNKTPDTDPRFIENITFDNSRKTAAEPGNTGSASRSTGSTAAPITNSDCHTQISGGAYQRLYNNMSGKGSEDERLGLFLEALKQHCFSSEMTGNIVGLLSTDAARFSALKNAYPKITDQSNFSSLGNLLTDAEWKEYFSDMVNR